MNYREEAFVFNCNGDALVSILARPDQNGNPTGVVVVVGGPQYRVGSHRQFVELARKLAEAGIPCLRFDYRGMGDSEGTARDFTNVNEDISAALDAFAEQCPSVTDYVLWGLCDGATAAALYAPTDPRVSGLVLLNPWAHTEQTEARVYLKYYYLRRLVSMAFWRKFFAGEFNPVRALRDGWILIRRAFGGVSPIQMAGQNHASSLPDRLRDSLTRRTVPILILLSGKDYVAREFEDLVAEDIEWKPIIDRADLERLPDADHTFSQPEDAAFAAEMTRDWILARYAITSDYDY